jgi:hypothetical protein
MSLTQSESITNYKVLHCVLPVPATPSKVNTNLPSKYATLIYMYMLCRNKYDARLSIWNMAAVRRMIINCYFHEPQLSSPVTTVPTDKLRAVKCIL